MATFPDYKPNYSATKKSQPKIRVVQFGDGYQHRISWGLHQNPKEWTLSFNVSEEDANIIEAFLDARAVDAQAFTWTPPDSNTPYKWICPSWTREMFSYDRSKIEVTFQEVYEA